MKIMKSPLEKPQEKPNDASGILVHCAHARLADVTSLVPNPRNPNRHDDKQIALLAKIIRHQGWRAPITISRRSGFIVTGHGRLEAAKLLGVELVPVDEQDFVSEADEWAHLIADNRIAELAEADRSLLRDLAEELDTGTFDMDLTGFDYAALEELMTAATPREDTSNVPIREAHEVIVECAGETEQRMVFEQLTNEGRKCRLSTF